MKINELFGDRQPQTKASMFASAARISLPKPIKDHRQQVRRNALSCITDSYLSPAIISDDRNMHLAARRRELDRIVDEIPQHLLHSRRVTLDRSASGLAFTRDLNAFLLCDRQNR